MASADAMAGRPDYGLDAPGLVRLFLFGGGALFVGGLVVQVLEIPSGFAHPAAWMGGSFFLTGVLMVASSRFGKFRVRDRILDRLELDGSEHVLDVGCGRGLLLVGAARQLPSGRAVGLDLWSQKDLSDNRRERTLQNAALEGVADRVEVRDGDMREMPFADAEFDAVVACFSIHNIPDRQGRQAAVREIARVLKPGGKVAIQDLGRTGEYARDLAAAAGLVDVERSFPTLLTFPPSRCVTARKPD